MAKYKTEMLMLPEGGGVYKIEAKNRNLALVAFDEGNSCYVEEFFEMISHLYRSLGYCNDINIKIKGLACGDVKLKIRPIEDANDET